MSALAHFHQAKKMFSFFQFLTLKLLILLSSPVASQIMAKYGWKDGQGNPK